MSARLDELLRIADAALYRAKQEGRDRAAIGDPVNLGGAERAPSEQRAAIDLRLLAAEG
jgi:predicted signal transduction protein with EAL and GGDEF domain